LCLALFERIEVIYGGSDSRYNVTGACKPVLPLSPGLGQKTARAVPRAVPASCFLCSSFLTAWLPHRKPVG
jgi:hypothetical protein